jgi:ornithine--oxo-acid transaminase
MSETGVSGGASGSIGVVQQGTAWEVCEELGRRGVLAKPTHDDIIRFAPPLVITEEQVDELVGILGDTLRHFEGRRAT